MLLKKTPQRQTRTRRGFVPSATWNETTMERRALAAPLFNLLPGSYLTAQAINSINTIPLVVPGLQASAAGSRTVTIPPSQGSGSATSTMLASTIVDTATGPNGASGILVGATMGGGIQGSVDTGFLLGVGTNARAASVDANGNPAPVTWSVTDSGGASSGFVTAIFTISGARGASGSNTAGLGGAATLFLRSNEMTINMNNGNTGLEITRNVGGFPIVVYRSGDPTNNADPDGSVDGRWSVGSPPRDGDAFSHSFTVSHIPVSLPYIESITYNSTLNVFAVPGVGAGQVIAVQPTLTWSYTVLNN